MKWQFPFFIYKSILCNMAAFKAHCRMGFWTRAMRNFITASKSDGERGQLGKITSLSDLPSDAVITGYIKRAMSLADAGIKMPAFKGKKKTPLVIPASIKKALKTNMKAQATFEAMSYSHKKEYVEWITEARQEETRARRLKAMLQNRVIGNTSGKSELIKSAYRTTTASIVRSSATGASPQCFRRATRAA